MSLLIEQLTSEVENTEVEKTAEEASMEKLAHEINVLDQSRTLVAVGEEMYKIAEELENDSLAALAVDTYQLGERMGVCLTKTASESGSALQEALEIAQDMHKVASVYAEIADDVQDEEFGKLASVVIDIANELVEEANEVMEKDASILSPDYDKAGKKLARTGTEGLGRKEVEVAKKAIEAQKKADLLKPLGGSISHGKTMKGQLFSKALQAKMLVQANPGKAAALGTAGLAAALAGAGYAASHKKK